MYPKFFYKKTILFTNSRGKIPNWLWESMDLAEHLHFRMNKHLPKPRRHARRRHAKPMGAKPMVVVDFADDITRRIDVLTKSVEKAIQSKPFFRIYSK